MPPYHQTPDTDLYHGDCRAVMAGLPACHFHCCITSPPYFGLRSYLPADHPDKPLEIGSEPSPAEFVATMLEVFGGRDNPVGVWRVLREDGVLFLNLGDSYTVAQGGRQSEAGQMPIGEGKVVDGRPRAREEIEGCTSWSTRDATAKVLTTRGHGLKPKDLLGAPWRIALALQEAGWYWRDVIAWHKPSPMPGSQRDRCTASWEPVLMLTKRARYFWDMEGAKEPAVGKAPDNQSQHKHAGLRHDKEGLAEIGPVTARVPRNVWRVDWDADDIVALLNFLNAEPGGNLWRIASEGFSRAHFATFPRALPAKCITAATSEKGCCVGCGAPWRRITEGERVATRPGTNTKADKFRDDPEAPHLGRTKPNLDPKRHISLTTSLGWRPGCECGGEPIPCRVLDPFAGAGTTALAARGLQRHCTLIELSEEYCEMIVGRLRAGLYHVAHKRDDLPGQMNLFEAV